MHNTSGLVCGSCSSRRTIVPYLDAFGMQVEEVPLASFVHPVQLQEGMLGLESGGLEQEELELDTFDGIYCLKITKRAVGAGT